MKQSKIRFLLLALLLAVKTNSFASISMTVDGIDYETINENEVRVKRNKNYKGSIYIPSEIYYKGTSYKVTEIGDKAFAACAINSVQLSDGLKVIGSDAFNECRGIKSIVLPNTVIKIGMYAFYNCYSLETVQLPNSLIEIGHSSFENCEKLISIIIPNSVDKIDYYVFKNCKHLTEVSLGTSVTRICGYAFYGCTNLISFIIPKSVKEVDMSAFEGCGNISFMAFEDGSEPLMVYGSNSPKYVKELYLGRNIKNNSSAFMHMGLERVTISSSVTEIAENEFNYAGHFDTLIIPNSVVKIGNWAFQHSIIDKLVLGKNVEQIGECAFDSETYDVTSLNPTPPSIQSSTFVYSYFSSILRVPKGSVDAYRKAKNWKFNNIVEIDSEDEDDSNTQHDKSFVVDGIHYKSTSSHNVSVVESQSHYSGDIVIPGTIEYGSNIYNVTSIADSAFYDCSNLSSVTIGDSITSIGIAAFQNCNSLNSLTIGKNVTTIKGGAFNNCNNLEKIIFNCQTITSWFQGKKSLRIVVIGSNVKSILNGAFQDCQLQYVQISDLETWCNIDFESNISTNSGSYLERKGVYVTYISNGLVCYSNPLDNAEQLIIDGKIVNDLVLPDNIKTIKQCAFWGCKGLTSVSLPQNLESIGRGAFKGCENLTSIKFGDKIKSIEYCAFTGCKKLQSVHLSSIAAWCNVSFGTMQTYFKSRDGMVLETTYDRYSNPLHLTHNLYLNNKLLSDLVIPEGVNKVNSEAFWGVNSITSITIPTTISSISSDAFDGCSSIDSITFNCQTVELWFKNKTSLKRIVLGDGVTSITKEAFSSCDNLLSVISHNTTPPDIKDDVFNERIYNNAVLYVPVGKKSLYSQHPVWGKFISILELVASGIYDVPIDQHQQKEGIYTIDGVKLSANADNTDNLPKGIYIINGKKVVIK